MKEYKEFIRIEEDLLKLNLIQGGGGYSDSYATWFYDQNFELKYFKSESWSEGGYGDSTFMTFGNSIPISNSLMIMDAGDYRLQIKTSLSEDTPFQ